LNLQLDSLKGEIEVWDWAQDGKRLLLCQVVQAVQNLYIYDLANAILKPLNHPKGGYNNAFFYHGNRILLNWRDAANSPQVVLLDGDSGEYQCTVLADGAAPPGRPWRSVSFPSSDGEEVQGWLCTPEGSGPFPTVLETHGGPEDVERERFDPGCQAWVDHGFAYLTINYRGSTTFGRKFQEQIWGNLGHWELEDMAAAHSWLVKTGVARPDQTLLTGWSYGGYLTLHALGKQPDLWAGGMAGVAIADWVMEFEDESEQLKGYDISILGGTPEEMPELYQEISPITHSAHVKAPVLIIQGKNDMRCPPRQIEAYEAKMQSLGKEIEVHWFDAGHGSLNVEEMIEHQELMIRFAYRALGYESE